MVLPPQTEWHQEMSSQQLYVQNQVCDKSDKFAPTPEAAPGDGRALTDSVFSSTGPREFQTKEIFHETLGNRVLFNYSYFYSVFIS